jgi:5-formyltetrahydrofolate cyclo-ligase
MMDKEGLRRLAEDTAENKAFSPGRLAEQVRRLAAYRATGAVFVGPALLLRQIRINVLGDGKRLLMPSAGLEEGFWSLAPYALPFGALAQAVTPQGIAGRGERLDLAALAGREIGLLVTDAVAVDRRGVMVGEGKGFFDLAVAILHAAGALSVPCTVVAVTSRFLAEATIDDAQPWDVRAGVVIHPAGVTELAASCEQPAICWEALPRRRLRRITPLWQLACRSGREGAAAAGKSD